MKILAIETSCDETAIAILEYQKTKFRILSSVVSSQVKLHAKWGGVVPMLAKREHQANLITVLRRTLKQSGLLNSKPQTKVNLGQSKQILSTILERELELLEKTEKFLKKYETPKIDLITVVNGPGLEPALWVGVNFAKALSVAWNKPLLPINHLEGHLFSVFLPENRKKNFQFSISNFQFPAVALLVSGGHTELVLVKNWLKYKRLGQTRDDAAGEAFDKVAKMLGLGYPGGPAISKLASNYQSSTSIIKLPRPMINTKDYDFSFSGLKTAVLYKTKKIKKLTPKIKAEICAEFQQAVIDVLISKTLRAVKEYKAKTVILGGGVVANHELRSQFKLKIKNEKLKIELLLPETKFTGDNAAMVALAGYFRHSHFAKASKNKQKKFPRTYLIKAQGNLELR